MKVVKEAHFQDTNIPTPFLGNHSLWSSSAPFYFPLSQVSPFYFLSPPLFKGGDCFPHLATILCSTLLNDKITIERKWSQSCDIRHTLLGQFSWDEIFCQTLKLFATARKCQKLLGQCSRFIIITLQISDFVILNLFSQKYLH